MAARGARVTTGGKFRPMLSRTSEESAHFAQAWWMVRDATRDLVLGDRVVMADTAWSRFWGLMGRRVLAPGEGLLLDPCSGVHTLFMRIPIDVVYLDRRGRVLRVLTPLRPWHAGPMLAAARYVFEGPAGCAAGVQEGDTCTWRRSP